MIDRVKKTIDTYDLVRYEESLLCCLSGGADSVALLICLRELGYDVRACHVNHNLRGAESDRDEQFCRKLCESLGIPISVHSIDVKGYAARHKLGTEHAARVMRYRIFAECGCDKICTAHTLSDSVETLLFNFARGTGLKGLASIPVSRDNIVRPLIECSRGEIEDFLCERGQDWVTDSTNLSDAYDRNKIRHNVIPRLSEVNPSLEKTARRTLSNLREDSAFIEQAAQAFYSSIQKGDGLDAEKLFSAAPALSGRAIKRLCTEYGHDCSRETAEAIRNICAVGEGKLTLGNGLYAVVKKSILNIERELPDIPYTEVQANGEGAYSFLDKTVEIKILQNNEKSANFHKKLTYFMLDYDKIKGDIVIRNRRAGDKLRLAGRGHTSDLRKLMQSKLPRAERSRCVLLSDNDGVIAAEGFGVADRVKVTGLTKAVLLCKISCDCHNKGI